jgi:hypothetical protein
MMPSALCGSTCVNLQTSAANCGSCSHSCLGGACLAGACQPFAIATGQGNPLGLSQDGVNLYWANETAGTVAKIAKAGAAKPTVIATGQSSPWATVSDGTDVYFVDLNGTGLLSVSVNGGTVTSALPGRFSSPDAIAIIPGVTAESGLLVADGTGIWSVTLPLGPIPKRVTTDATAWVATDGTYAYSTYLAKDAIVRTSLSASTTTTLGTFPSAPTGIALNGSTPFFGVGAQVYTIGGAGSMSIATDASGAVTGIWADANGVVWTNNSGTVEHVGLTGGAVKQLATGQNDPAYPLGDVNAYYWIDIAAGDIMGLAK